jgi:hypothetical protein
MSCPSDDILNIILVLITAGSLAVIAWCIYDYFKGD